MVFFDSQLTGNKILQYQSILQNPRTRTASGTIFSADVG